MDFFAAQDRAKSRTRTLVVYFILGVAGLIVSLYFAVLVIFGFARNYQGGHNRGRFAYVQTAEDFYNNETNPGFDLWHPGLFTLVSLGTLAVVGGACMTKIGELRAGGGAVARSVGGVLVSPQTTNLGEKRLRNIVEEMALAAGVPVPEVYVMEQDGINAFAAGFRPEDAAVTVTRGALRHLTRDELQGVIGHEFSHILNGDMRLNVELIGAVFGLLVLAVIGRGMVYMVSRTGGGRRGGDRGGDPRMAILFLGFALIVIGCFGVFFGRLIQSAVSRQRERLADASGVQFTRNPAGLADALKKIGGLAAGSHIEDAHAQETAHMFFAPALDGVFATHPPLEERIRELDPHWDGKFIVPALVDGPDASPASTPSPLPQALRSMGLAMGGLSAVPLPASIGGVMASASAGGLMAPASVVAAVSLANMQAWRSSLAPSITDALTTATGCRALTLAVALSENPAVRVEQLEKLREQAEPAAGAAAQLAADVAALPPGRNLPLLELALAGLAATSVGEKNFLLARLRELTNFDRGQDLHEFALWRVAQYRLQPRPPRQGPTDPEAYRNDLSVVLSALAHLSTPTDTAAQPVFAKGQSTLGFTRPLVLTPRALATLENVEAACARLEGASFALKKQLLEAAVIIVQYDNVVEPSEAELLRALAASLGCPLPPG